ncbi:MAG TPA: DinB family protein [Thermomicrobiales bacterium]|nr:DinB family protein [Thermomicrobiales bacterium]
MPDTVDTIRDTCRTILHNQHDRWRNVVNGLNAEALNWKPGDETNSIAVLLSHGLDAERFCVANSVDVTLDRDREAKFRTQVSSADDLLSVIDESEREIDGYLDRMTADSLSAEVTRGDRTRTGAWWVLHSLEHSCEHAGQAELTRQLWEHRG